MKDEEKEFKQNWVDVSEQSRRLVELGEQLKTLTSENERLKEENEKLKFLADSQYKDAWHKTIGEKAILEKRVEELGERLKDQRLEAKIEKERLTALCQRLKEALKFALEMGDFDWLTGQRTDKEDLKQAKLALAEAEKEMK